MRNLMNSDQSYTGLVQKYIGSAYDNVLNVSTHMEYLLILAKMISDGDLEKFLSQTETLKETLHALQQFNSVYYGKSATEPTHRPLTTPDAKPEPPHNGDMYYDLNRHGMYIFNDGTWQPMSGVGSKVESHTIHKSQIDIFDGSVHLTLDNPYRVGINNIMVFVNATYQFPITTATPKGAYREVDKNTLLFPYGLEDGDTVTILIGDTITAVDHEVTVTVERFHISSYGQKKITLTADNAYIPGVNNIEVFRNGLRQERDLDFYEDTLIPSRDITFNRPLDSGDKIVVKRGEVLGQVKQPTGGDPIVVIPTAGQFYNRQINENKVVFLEGYHFANDGGSGFFLYNPGMSRGLANGGTIIDASVSLANQGQGTPPFANGCWVRVYSGELKPEWFGATDSTISLMMNQIGPGQQGDILVVHGYHTKGDGGEGAFVWDGNADKREHDGGITMDTDQTFPSVWDDPIQMEAWYTPTTVVGKAGCWVRMERENASIRWYGAKGDGTTNDSWALYAMGVALKWGDTAQIAIPAGRYKIDNSHNAKMVDISGVGRIYGVGSESKIIFDTSSNDVPMEFRKSDGIIVENIHFETLRAPFTTSAMVFKGCTDVQVRNCVFKDFGAQAIKVESDHRVDPVTGASNWIPCDDIHILNNRFENCGNYNNNRSLTVNTQALASDVIVKNNIFNGCTGISVGSNIRGMKVQDNIFLDTTNAGILIQNFNDIAVSGNNFLNGQVADIIIDTSGILGYADGQLNYCAVSDNYSEGAADVHMCELKGDRETTGPIIFNNNHAVNRGLVLIQPGVPMDRVVISENTVRNTSDAIVPIVVSNAQGGTLAHASITNNTIEVESTSRLEAFLAMTGARYPFIADNHFLGAGQNEITLVECPGTMIVNNQFRESNRVNNPNQCCITIVQGAPAKYAIKGNTVDPGLDGKPLVLVNATQRFAELDVINNFIPGGMEISTTNINTGIVGNTMNQFGKIRHMYGPAIPLGGPTAVVYNVGDLVWNTQPLAGQHIGWVCVTQGSPGTWKPFGSILP